MEEHDMSADAALERIQAALNSYGSESPYCESTIDPNYDVARIRGRLNLAGELLEALEGLLREADAYALKDSGPMAQAREAIAKAHGEAQDG